jgi:GLPGLI family protein
MLLGVLVMLTAAQVVFGQTTEGVITYEVKVNMHRRLPPEREAMKNMIPEFNTHKDQLVFNGNESLYKPVEEEEDDEFSSNDGGMHMKFKRPMTEHYVEQSTSKRVVLQEFMGKNYLIEDTLKITPWKFGTETRTVAGYACRQASYFNEERKQNITAWYTDKLRPFLGPETFGTLPGAVLQVDINDGERVITAQKIEARPLKKGELKVPSGGTKITEKEFRQMVDEQMKRMGAQGGIIIRN